MMLETGLPSAGQTRRHNRGAVAIEDWEAGPRENVQVIRLCSTNEKRPGERRQKTNQQSSRNEFDQFHCVPGQACVHLQSSFGVGAGPL